MTVVQDIYDYGMEIRNDHKTQIKPYGSNITGGKFKTEENVRKNTLTLLRINCSGVC